MLATLCSNMFHFTLYDRLYVTRLCICVAFLMVPQHLAHKRLVRQVRLLQVHIRGFCHFSEIITPPVPPAWIMITRL
jgi:hypothetical protein